MITLICTHCRATLEMDDGFAGGACRCQHCGTIQTVPSRLKLKSAEPVKTRTLYKNRPESVAPSSGLDQLADIVASSGMESGRLRKDDPAVAKQQKKLRTMLIASASVIGVLSIALIVALTKNNETTAVPPAPVVENNVAPQPTPAKPKNLAPNFCGVPLNGETVVYVLDRGDSTRDNFGYLKDAALKSAASLGADRRFQIVFWNNGSDDAYPPDWPTTATPEHLSAAQRAIDDIAAHGKTTIGSSLKKAIAGNPADVVIVTGKAWDLDDSFVQTVDTLRGEKNIRIHTVSLGDPGTSTALQTAAAKSRGSFKTVSETDLKDFAR